MLTTKEEDRGNKKVRGKRWIVPAALSALLIGLCVTLMVLQASAPPAETARNGKATLSTDYGLAYKPNALYDDPKPADKEARLLAYVDHVDFRFRYDLTGLEGLPADVTWSVDALLVANSSETSKYVDPDFVLWQKKYTLAEPEKVPSVGGALSLDNTVQVNVAKYAEFAASVYEQTQVQTTNELKLLFHANTVVHGPMGDTTDSSTVELVIPMIDSLLVVTGTPTKENALRVVTAVAAPGPNYGLWTAISGALALLSLAAACKLAVKKKKPDPQMLYARMLARIFKQHGERLVRLEKPLPFQLQDTIPIDGIGEMIKIADEINQPVFYHKADNPGEQKVEFFVFESGRVYYMVLLGAAEKVELDMGAEAISLD